MSDESEHERIARKAHEIWESEGHPHGRDQSHWDQAKEIIALHDSMGDTLLPRDTGASEPEEPTQAVEPFGDVPGLTDQGRDDLTSTDREPEITKPPRAVQAPAAATPAAAPKPVASKPAAAPSKAAGLPPVAAGAGEAGAGTAPRAAGDARPGAAPQASPVGNAAPVTGKNPPKPAAPPAGVTRGKPPVGRR